MARLVVVSRNAALPFALNSAGHEVVVLDDEADVRWGEFVGFADVVLLDLGDPHVCELLIDSVARSATTPVRVLLLASTAPAWDALKDNPRTGTGVLPLPLSMPRLSEALKELLHGPPLAHITTPAPAPAETPERRQEPSQGPSQEVQQPAWDGALTSPPLPPAAPGPRWGWARCPAPAPGARPAPTRAA